MAQHRRANSSGPDLQSFVLTTEGERPFLIGWRYNVCILEPQDRQSEIKKPSISKRKTLPTTWKLHQATSYHPSVTLSFHLCQEVFLAEMKGHPTVSNSPFRRPLTYTTDNTWFRQLWRHLFATYQRMQQSAILTAPRSPNGPQPWPEPLTSR